MPSDMPQWMWNAMDEGLFVRRSMEKVAGLETQIKNVKTELARLAAWEPQHPDPIGPLRGMGYLAGIKDAVDSVKKMLIWK